MAIGLAIQRGDRVYVYDSYNHALCNLLGELVGFTSSTVSVKRGGFVYTYDEQGHQQAARGV